MCRNHSHVKVEATGFLTVGPTTLIEYRVKQPLVLELPYGEKWTKACMSALWIPVSNKEPLPASMPQVMAVCYTPLSYMVDGDTTFMRAMEARPTSSSPTAPLVLSRTDSFPTNTAGGYDDELPF